MPFARLVRVFCLRRRDIPLSFKIVSASPAIALILLVFDDGARLQYFQSKAFAVNTGFVAGVDEPIMVDPKSVPVYAEAYPASQK